MSWITQFSGRMIRSRKRRGFLSPMSLIAICGIAFGMAATLVSLSVMSGFEKAYESSILGFNAHIVLIQEGEINKVDQGVVNVLSSFGVTKEEAGYWKEHAFYWKWLKGLPLFKDPKMEEMEGRGIVAMTPFIFREGLGIFPDEVSGVVLKGVDPESMREVYPLRYEAVGGLKSEVGSQTSEFRYQTSDRKEENLVHLLKWRREQLPPVIIGKALYDRFFPEGNSEEAPIKLLIPKGEVKGEKPNLKDYAQTFRVVGTFESGLYEFDSQFLMTSLSVMRKLFHLSAGATGIELRLDDPAKAPAMARMIEEKLPMEFQAISWDELNESLFTAMKMEKNLFAIIMLLIILIASFNVMGSILMLILNRQPETAILIAMGARKSEMHRSFALQGLFLGAVGVIIGMMMSFGFLFTLKRYEWFSLDPQIYFISRLPVEWPFGLWFFLAVITLMICYFISQIASRMVVKYGVLVKTFR